MVEDWPWHPAPTRPRSVYRAGFLELEVGREIKGPGATHLGDRKDDAEVVLSRGLREIRGRGQHYRIVRRELQLVVILGPEATGQRQQLDELPLRVRDARVEDPPDIRLAGLKGELPAHERHEEQAEPHQPVSLAAKKTTEWISRSCPETPPSGKPSVCPRPRK